MAASGTSFLGIPNFRSSNEGGETNVHLLPRSVAHELSPRMQTVLQMFGNTAVTLRSSPDGQRHLGLGIKDVIDCGTRLAGGSAVRDTCIMASFRQTHRAVTCVSIIISIIISQDLDRATEQMTVLPPSNQAVKLHW